jgi:hypothetical protein
MALLRSLRNRDEQILNLLVVDFHHRHHYLILSVGVCVRRNPVKNFLAANGDDSLDRKGLTLLAPYPTIE